MQLFKSNRKLIYKKHINFFSVKKFIENKGAYYNA